VPYGLNRREKRMASPLQWDRMLETCFKRDGYELRIVPGSPISIRLPNEWRTLQIDPPKPADLIRLANEIFDDIPGNKVGIFAEKDIAYGTAARFLIRAHHFPQTTALDVFRLYCRPQPSDGNA